MRRCSMRWESEPKRKSKQAWSSPNRVRYRKGRKCWKECLRTELKTISGVYSSPEGASMMTTTQAAGEITYLEAISQALDEEMTRDERVFLMGEDIGAYGGAFKITEGFLQKYGE